MSSEITIESFNSFQKPPFLKKNKILDFLHNQLDQYGDPKNQILSAMDYALKEIPSHGGFIITASINKEIVGATVVNRTGMSGYIPENILVYIAVHNDYRGRGLGKRIMKRAIETANGGIALHVEPDNPAKYLYESLGFTSKYLEMRLTDNKEENARTEESIENKRSGD